MRKRPHAVGCLLREVDSLFKIQEAESGLGWLGVCRVEKGLAFLWRRNGQLMWGSLSVFVD